MTVIIDREPDYDSVAATMDARGRPRTEEELKHFVLGNPDDVAPEDESSDEELERVTSISPEKIEQPDYGALTDEQIEANTEDFSLNDAVSALHSATPSMLPYLTAQPDKE